MDGINKLLIGAIVGVGIVELTRSRPAPPPAVQRVTQRNGKLLARRVAPALTADRVRMMVADWGMPADRFHGRARAWAQLAEAEVRRRLVEAPMALPAAPVAAPADETLDGLLERFFSSSPRGGNYYAIQPGDTPATIALAVLTDASDGAEITKSMVADYIWCFSACQYNLDRYGGRSTSNSFLASWIVPGLGQGLRAAFLPRNADALDYMSNGTLPPRTVDGRAVRIADGAGSLGTVWLPPVASEQLPDGVVTCFGHSWPDGSTALEPPPTLIGMLQDA